MSKQPFVATSRFPDSRIALRQAGRWFQSIIFDRKFTARILEGPVFISNEFSAAGRPSNSFASQYFPVHFQMLPRDFSRMIAFAHDFRRRLRTGVTGTDPSREAAFQSRPVSVHKCFRALDILDDVRDAGGFEAKEFQIARQ